MEIIQISKNLLMPTVWGGGTTFEYFIYPQTASYAKRDFLFRISGATIDKVPSNFTRFKNYRRFLVMLDDNLHLMRNGIEESYTSDEIFKFDSNDEIVSYTKGNDFNLMVSNHVGKAEVLFLKDSTQLSEPFVFLFAKTGTILIVNNEEVHLKSEDLLIIENKEKNILNIRADKTVIAGCLVV